MTCPVVPLVLPYLADLGIGPAVSKQCWSLLAAVPYVADRFGILLVTQCLFVAFLFILFLGCFELHWRYGVSAPVGRADVFGVFSARHGVAAATTVVTFR